MPRNRRFATVEKSYITDIERERCKKVAAAYAELYCCLIMLRWRMVCSIGCLFRPEGKAVKRKEGGTDAGRSNAENNRSCD